MEPKTVSVVSLVNGPVRPGDWVRERPASHHFKPCYCCLCRPVSGERPVYRVKDVFGGAVKGQAFLRLADGEGRFPAEEFELAAKPAVDRQGDSRVNLRGLSGQQNLRRIISAT